MLSEWKLAVIFSEGRYLRNMKIRKCWGSQVPHFPFLLNKPMSDLKAYIFSSVALIRNSGRYLLIPGRGG